MESEDQTKNDVGKSDRPCLEDAAFQIIVQRSAHATSLEDPPMARVVGMVLKKDSCLQLLQVLLRVTFFNC